MDFNEYQDKAKETMIYPKLNPPWIYPALGLAGESGEVLEKLKKFIRDGSDDAKIENLKKELGDILWYVSALATEFGFKMSDIAEQNISKLASRKERNVLQGSGDNR